MAREDVPQTLTINRPSFQKLQDSRVVFESPCAQRQSNQIFSTEDPSPYALYFGWHSFRQGIFFQIIASRQELHRPVPNYDVLAFYATTTVAQIGVEGRKSEQRAVRQVGKYDQNIDIEGGSRFQIECRPNCAGYGIVVDDTIRLHLVDYA